MSAVPQPLPTAVRVMLLVTVAVGAMVSFGAAQEVAVALTIDSPPPSPALDPGRASMGLTPEAQRAAVLAGQSAIRGAVQSMATSRVLISILLSSAASLVFLLAMRLRWTLGPRGPLVVLLRRFAVAAAVLRTAEGAQQLVISQAMMASVIGALVKEKVPEADELVKYGQAAISVMSVSWTMFVVGLFVGVSRFFAAESVTQAFAKADAALPPEQ